MNAMTRWLCGRKTVDAKAIVAFAAGALVATLVLGVVLFYTNQGIDAL